MLSRLSLRTRLILGAIVLAGIGIVAADAATYTQLQSFLLQRVDNSLTASHPGVETAAFPPQIGKEPGGDRDIGGRLGSLGGDCVEVRSLSGIVVKHACVPEFGSTVKPPTPAYPKTISLPTRPTTSEGDRVRFLDVHAVTGDMEYRVRASIERDQPNYILFIAAPLSGVDSTLHRVLLVELLATLAALGGVAALGLWVVRLGLRPLREIEATATAITAGDLSHRVEVENEHTEVGHVALALNAMLGRIEASDQRLRRFVADASHELRTPLAAVRAYAELFSRGAQSRPEDLARTMSGISREAERMSVLVEDLLLLARLDEGRPLERESVQLDDLVGEAVETARTLDPARKIELVTEPVEVLGDRDRLRQVMDNLLSNVRSHTPAASPARVSVTRENGRAVIEVGDTGPGLSEDELVRVFERFYRADTSRARASGGVGLGLSIVAAVARAHGGSVGVSSEPDLGAIFRVELPVE
ncbi:MAG TPA: HAMP domain-containing sensor histidine kinase [Gaiellaceae bacterium]|nr:HAMP domain-containing sensor histidine kinase [Gaiellaceae bacterium]